jgi:hypothetical protein
MKIYKCKQEFYESFDIVGNGFYCETRKIVVEEEEKEIGSLHYNEEISKITIENKILKIIRHYKFFSASKIEVINQLTSEEIGSIKIPFWHKNSYNEIGEILILDKRYTIRRLNTINSNKNTYWDYSI